MRRERLELVANGICSLKPLGFNTSATGNSRFPTPSLASNTLFINSRKLKTGILSLFLILRRERDSVTDNFPDGKFPRPRLAVFAFPFRETHTGLRLSNLHASSTTTCYILFTLVSGRNKFPPLANCGEKGIRTLDRFDPILRFECSAINRTMRSLQCFVLWSIFVIISR